MASIVGPLLTGGILIGKICQSLSEIVSSRAGVGAEIVSEVSSGGVTFYRRVENGISEIRAFNRSTSLPAVVQVPNGTNGDGVSYIISPTETVPFPDASSSLVPPTTSVLAGAITADEAAGGVQAGGSSLFKLAFSGLNLGTTVTVGSFQLSCNTTQLFITTAGVTLTALTYMSLNSNKGVTAASTDVIPAKSSGPRGDEDKTFAFDLELDELGIDTTNDHFGGFLNFTMDASLSDLKALSKAPSRPLDATERAYFNMT